MYSILPSGGHELADITYEVTQLRHTLLEQSVGQEAIVEVRPNVLKLCNFVKEPSSELSMIWLGTQAIDDTIALTKKQNGYPLSLELPEIAF